MGISKKERERIEKFATDENWLDRQTAKYEIHYQTEPPVRTDQETDQGKCPQVIPCLSTPSRIAAQPCRDAPIPCRSVRIECWGCKL